MTILLGQLFNKTQFIISKTNVCLFSMIDKNGLFIENFSLNHSFPCTLSKIFSNDKSALFFDFSLFFSHFHGSKYHSFRNRIIKW